jgi:putative aminopeptidase FrvX
MTSAAIDDRIAVTAAATVTKASLDVDHLITLSGVSAAADSLGTFTGSTISDDVTIKAAIQAVETAVETKAAVAGPTFTGTPAAPTAAQATNTTQIATTAFVQSNLTATLLRSALGITENNGDPADSRGVYFDTGANKYLTSS